MRVPRMPNPEEQTGRGLYRHDELRSKNVGVHAHRQFSGPVADRTAARARGAAQRAAATASVSPVEQRYYSLFIAVILGFFGQNRKS